jgi:hypothetical protein
MVRKEGHGMKLNTVIEHMPINKALAIYENNKLFYFGSPIGFRREKKPKNFRSRSVLSMYADNDILIINISNEPTFVSEENKK